MKKKLVFSIILLSLWTINIMGGSKIKLGNDAGTQFCCCPGSDECGASDCSETTCKKVVGEEEF